MVTRLRRTRQVEERSLVNQTPELAFSLCSQPNNIKRFVPKGLTILMKSKAQDLRPGTKFSYKFKLWPLDLTWETVVSEYSSPNGITNIQSKGFFPRWTYTYALKKTESREQNPATELLFKLEYEIPTGLRHRMLSSHIHNAMTDLVHSNLSGITKALIKDTQ